MDALDSRFDSRGIKLTVAISTLVVSIFYLIPQMVGAGALIKPLLGIRSEYGVIIVGFTVIVIVVTAGMVSTTWVQFIKGSLLVIFCFILTVMILHRGLKVDPESAHPTVMVVDSPLGELRTKNPDGTETYWRPTAPPQGMVTKATDVYAVRTQVLTNHGNQVLVNGRPQSKENDLHPVGTVAALPDGKIETGPLGPLEFISTLQNSNIVTWAKEPRKEKNGDVSTVFYPVEKKGSDLLTPGASPTFAGVRSTSLFKKLDFLSLMLALFCGTASKTRRRQENQLLSGSRRLVFFMCLRFIWD